MKNNKLKNWTYGIGAVVVLIGLFVWPAITDENGPLIRTWNEAGVECLDSHLDLAQHFHPQLFINVDGINESLSGNIGIVRGCMAETHIHGGESNIIHVESVWSDKEFNLGQFVESIYGQPIERAGYILEMKVNGEDSAEYGDLKLEDEQVIELNYTSI